MAEFIRSDLIKSKTISHTCNRCGTCCLGRGDIYLTPANVFLISKYLNIHPQTLIERYCRREGLEVVLRSKGANRACVFHEAENGKTKCQIYPERPLACYLFPLGCKGEDDFQLHYSPFCSKSKDNEKTIEEYIQEKSNYNFDRDNFIKNTFFNIVLKIEEKNLSPEQQEFFFLKLFLSYDLNKDMMLQLNHTFSEVMYMLG